MYALCGPKVLSCFQRNGEIEAVEIGDADYVAVAACAIRTIDAAEAARGGPGSLLMHIGLQDERIEWPPSLSGRRMFLLVSLISVKHSSGRTEAQVRRCTVH